MISSFLDGEPKRKEGAPDEEEDKHLSWNVDNLWSVDCLYSSHILPEGFPTQFTVQYLQSSHVKKLHI